MQCETVKIKKNVAERVIQTCCCCCAPTFHPYVVTCNVIVLYCLWQSYLRTYSVDSQEILLPPDARF